MKLIITLDRISYWMSKIGAIVSGIMIVLTIVMICAYIVNRQFIGQIWLFVEEWTALALLPISYLGMAYTLRWNRHLRVDVFTSRCGTRTQNILTIIVCIFSLVVMGFMIERGIDWFWYNWADNVRSSGSMRTPLWIFSLPMVLGLIMFFLDTFFYLINSLLSLFGRPERLKFYE